MNWNGLARTTRAKISELEPIISDLENEIARGRLQDDWDGDLTPAQASGLHENVTVSVRTKREEQWLR